MLLASVSGKRQSLLGSVPVANTRSESAPLGTGMGMAKHTRDRQRIGLAGLWGLLWVLCFKIAANGEQSCYRHMFELRCKSLIASN